MTFSIRRSIPCAIYLKAFEIAQHYNQSSQPSCIKYCEYVSSQHTKSMRLMLW